MSRFISIDPSSTVTGWAAFQGDDLVAWGKIDTAKVAYSFRFQHIVNELIHAVQTYNAQEIAVEDVKFAWHSKNRNRNIAGLQIVFRSISEWAKSVKMPLTPYNPATWKNSIVGHVNASKETTKENLCLRFPSLPRNLTDHEYDAIAIGCYHASLKRLGEFVD
jgi:Holliday junction resolvasome RuvABC endonuclease subunit